MHLGIIAKIYFYLEKVSNLLMNHLLVFNVYFPLSIRNDINLFSSNEMESLILILENDENFHFRKKIYFTNELFVSFNYVFFFSLG